MPDEDRVQMIFVAQNLTTEASGSAIAEMGARGEAVSIVAIHWFYEFSNVANEFRLHCGLSSNPEHEHSPPVTEAVFVREKSVYGRGDWFYDTLLTTSGGQSLHSLPIVIPLYGIIRPRRQVVVWVQKQGESNRILGAEIYYRPVSLGREDLDSLNLKYGKYRRSA